MAGRENNHKKKKEVFGCQATAEGPPGLLTDLYEMKKERKETTMIVGFLQQRWTIRGTQEKTRAIINIHLSPSPQANLL